MANPSTTPAQERRINELDQDIERIFDVRKRLGKGAYGIVWKATDRRTKDTVALKKIFDAFRDETDAQRTYREVIFLRAFRHHPNIIRLMDVFKAGNNLDFYLVFEYMESDLHNVIKKGDVLKDIHKRFVMYQLINAIKYMHSGNVIHRDLKPSNILIDSKCRLKVADFGLARTLSNKRNSEFDDREHEGMLTDYVATRWYRAPEILVASRKYTKGIDMWGLGCILGEMIRQKPLFQGTSTVNQIEKIVTALPDVTQRDIESIGPSFGSALLSKKIHRDRRLSLDEMLRNCCDDAISLVKSLLVLDPYKRLTAKAAIMHPYVSRFRTASADMELRVDIHPPLKDDVRYGVDRYRSNLYDMIGLESRGSARTVSNATPSNNRETMMTTTTITKPQRSVSRTRTMSATQLPSQAEKKEARREPQPVEAEQPLAKPIDQPEAKMNRRPRHTISTAELRALRARYLEAETPPGGSPPALITPKAKSRSHQAALHRELAAVAATAPRKKPVWQTQAQAQVKFQVEAQAQVQALLQTQLPILAKSMAETPPQESPQQASRSRSVRKANQEKKPKEKAKAAEVTRTSGNPNQRRDKSGSTAEKSKQELLEYREHREKLVQQQQQQREKLLQLQREQKEKLLQREQKEHKDRRRRMAENHRLMELERIQLEEMANQKATAKAFNQIARKVKKLTEKKDKVEAKAKAKDKDKDKAKKKGKEQEEEDPNSDSDLFYTPNSLGQGENASGTNICYRSKISYLEAEMDKCKRQLVNFVQDNRELLTHRKLRYHFEKLQNEKKKEEEEQNQSQNNHEQDGKPLPEGSGDPGSLTYDCFRREQRRQKSLQLQEFLSRDDKHDYEFPELFGSKTYHAFAPVPSGSSLSSPEEASVSPDSESEHSQEQDYSHQYAKYFPSLGQEEPLRLQERLQERLEEHRRRHEELQAQMRACKKQHESLGLHHKVHHHHHNPGASGPRYDHMRLRHEDIQEANFF
ncbi:extracellular signal-regulated kinase 7 [Drosophila ficusphila]|uniref:extracellular signal-regulated kinase 7 n=1 Tax=Drosophila ficusphila TaxID=30025 RepID=UPI0007E6F4EA|nr:extracellular signal-regulated kinase 7 [Drosophila ficusphila]XP_017055574.1 extracellular signal-regulated kinase 7 [Drosophila ficusphila]XP_017055576.1 extracellular signal-regulated kinase 7 [Drosophila ficusphila]